MVILKSLILTLLFLSTFVNASDYASGDPERDSDDFVIIVAIYPEMERLFGFGVTYELTDIRENRDGLYVTGIGTSRSGQSNTYTCKAPSGLKFQCGLNN